MKPILTFFRDSLSGTHYFIYAFILSILMFSLIGYLFKQKYGKLEIKLNTSQTNNNKEKEQKAKEQNKVIQPIKEINNVSKDVSIKPEVANATGQTITATIPANANPNQQNTNVVVENSSIPEIK